MPYKLFYWLFSEEDPCCEVECFNGGFCDKYMTTGTTTAMPLSAAGVDNTEPAAAAPAGDPEAPPGCYCMPNTEGDQCQGSVLMVHMIVST